MAKIHINVGSLKKRKRGERIFWFESFCKPGHPTYFDGSFQENMRVLLGLGQHEVIVQEGFECWSFHLKLHQNSPKELKLFVLEENVGVSPHRQCYYCRSVGWGNHMICNKRFHFVLPSKESSIEQAENLIIEVNGLVSEKPTERSKLQMEVENHIMHGIFHLNGFGHLICINGFEGGSEFISGHQIMDFWDRICMSLQVRQVSLTDVAKKGTMELRLIHGLAYGEPWFERWGYRFGHGSYGITEPMYRRSIQALQSLPLALLIPPLYYTILDADVLNIATKYQSITSKVLKTIGDLFQCMMELKAKLPNDIPPTATTLDFHAISPPISCRWSMKRIEMAAQVIVSELKRSENRWVTRQEVREAARVYIGDTGLLDYVLKSMGNRIIDNYIVRRIVNPVTKVLEYCLQDISIAFSSMFNCSSPDNNQNILKFQISRLLINKDMFYLYKHFLMSTQPHYISTRSIPSTIPTSINVLLDTKHLIKDYNINISQHNNIDSKHSKLTCFARLRGQFHIELLPNEIMRIPTNSTISDLKREVKEYYKSTYLGLKNFVADVVVLENVASEQKDCDDNLVVGLMKINGGVILVEGNNNCRDEDAMFECGNGEVVDCLCGAKEEDGEMMVSCDICEVLQHTRCIRIPNKEEVPCVFLCRRCEGEIVKLPLM